MGWVNWLKGLADRQEADADGKAAPRQPAAPRRGHKGGAAYAKEWVKVLEDTAPGRDPNGTWTWELHPEAEQAAREDRVAPAAKGRGAKPDDPFDTYTWEVQETDDRNDPWGLKREDPPQKPQKQRRDGINPYDTGVFDASWTGRFDQR